MFADIVKSGSTVGQLSMVHCKDGFRMSVIAHSMAYARKNEEGEFIEVEVGFPSEKPEPWSKWDSFRMTYDSHGKAEDSVYAFVPVEAVERLIELHGGEREYM